MKVTSRFEVKKTAIVGHDSEFLAEFSMLINCVLFTYWCLVRNRGMIHSNY